jgi:UbiD family decarboxylase
MPLTDLRQYIEALRNLGEIQEIAAPVSLNLEVGAIIRRCCEAGSPAPLFSAFSDHPSGFRILGAPAATSAQRDLEMVRAATSLELPAKSSGPDIAEAIAASLDLPAIDPEIVEHAPCFENVSTGDDVDLTRLPVPLLHEGDGGRYLNTFGCIVARTPDGSWTNWSIARIMLVDGKRMTGLVAAEQHIGIVSKAWADIGKPMPFALALGVEPSIPFICAMPLPAHVSEGGRLGALMRRPIKTVRCRTLDLEAPASAEILIEGYLHLDEKTKEGPMGEYPGYVPLGPAMDGPVYHVTAISHRNDAILPVVAAGEPAEENHTVWGTGISRRSCMICGPPAFPSPPPGYRCTPRSTGSSSPCRATGGAARASTRLRPSASASARRCSRPRPGWWSRKCVLNDDIDPTNLKELVWSFATRCHPLTGHAVFGHDPVDPLVAYLRTAEKIAGTTGKIVYNCLPPDEWGEALPIRASFRHAYPAEIIDRVTRRWSEYGFL